MGRMIKLCLLAVFAPLFSLPALAQDVVGGNLSTAVSFGQIGGYTIANLDTPFNADGQITTFTARFAYFHDATVCAAGDFYKVRVFRPNTGNMYELVAERGPFAESVPTVTVALTPPITVKRGDVLAVALYGPGQCGLTGYYGSQNHLVQFDTDYIGGQLPYSVDVPGSSMNFRASSASPALVGTLPGAGVTGGASGSSFNTSLSITNPSTDLVTLTFTYRAAGVSPVTATLAVPANATKSPKLTDLMSINGVGSIDVYSNGATPLVNARVYNDTGSGTNGFTEPMVAPTAFAHEFDRLWLNIPSDLSAFRMNIGVRTGASGATFGCAVFSPGGTAVASVAKTYGPNATSLEPLQGFFNNNASALSAGGSVSCVMSSDSRADLILYGTVTDNHTNDSAMFLAERH